MVAVTASVRGNARITLNGFEIHAPVNSGSDSGNRRGFHIAVINEKCKNMVKMYKVFDTHISSDDFHIFIQN